MYWHNWKSKRIFWHATFTCKGKAAKFSLAETESCALRLNRGVSPWLHRHPSFPFPFSFFLPLVGTRFRFCLVFVLPNDFPKSFHSANWWTVILAITKSTIICSSRQEWASRELVRLISLPKPTSHPGYSWSLNLSDDWRELSGQT